MTLVKCDTLHYPSPMCVLLFCQDLMIPLTVARPIQIGETGRFGEQGLQVDAKVIQSGRGNLGARDFRATEIVAHQGLDSPQKQLLHGIRKLVLQQESCERLVSLCTVCFGTGVGEVEVIVQFCGDGNRFDVVLFGYEEHQTIFE